MTIREFGADDRLTCPTCGGSVLVTRRAPYLTDTEREFQMLTCVECHHGVSRVVGRDGTLVHGDDENTLVSAKAVA